MSYLKNENPGRPATVADLQQLGADLEKAIRKFLVAAPAPLQKPWLKSHEVLKMLKISAGTLQHLRDSGQLKFSKVGGIIFYELKDIEGMIKAMNR
jgi:hypothetical protein